MKKFIVAFDGLKMSQSAMLYAIFLAKGSKAHLVGIFLEDFARRSYGMRELVEYEGPDRDEYVRVLDERDDVQRDQSVRRFTDACRAENISFSVHRDRNVALQELLEESIYADLLILDAAETMTEFSEPPPSRFVRDVLSDVQCPVLLAPAAFTAFDKVVLLYDGELSSVNAVKAFSNVYPNPDRIKTEVVTVSASANDSHLPNGRLIKEFIERHYPAAHYVLLNGNPEKEILAYLQNEKAKPLLVLGAYRRNKLSRLFKPSMADTLLQSLHMPLFIAHNKV